MDCPRLIYFNDGHHLFDQSIEHPVSRHVLQLPVDEVVGTGVDLLVSGLGCGDVFFHDSKVGRVVGQQQETWESCTDRRTSSMVEAARRLYTDSLREVLARGLDLGLPVFPSLKLQDVTPPGSERCGTLKWERDVEVCIGVEGRYEYAYDWALEEVRESKLEMMREALEEYGADGIELDFACVPCYFQAGQEEAGQGVMTGFMEEVRHLARQIGEKQRREICVMVRVPVERERNLAMGLDVESWLEAGSVDFAVGQEERLLADTQPRPTWLPQAAARAEGAAYYRPPQRVYHESAGLPTLEMARALRQTLDREGYAGLYCGDMPWPLAGEECALLREMAFPEVLPRHPKRYYLQPREGAAGAETTTPERVLPAELTEGRTIEAEVWVADDVDGARRDGEMCPPILTLRFSDYCMDDEVEMRFNGRLLDRAAAEVTEDRALTMATQLASGMEIQAPLSMSAQWFGFRLEPEEVRPGRNLIEVECRRRDPRAGLASSLNGVELYLRYRDFGRPAGPGMERNAPI